MTAPEYETAASEDDAVSTGISPDPVIRWLGIGIIALLAVWAVTLGSAFVFGSIGNPTGAPRTSSERELALLEEQVASGKSDTQTWARYVDALTATAQYSKAQDMLSRGLSSAKADRSYLLVSQSGLSLATKDPGKAVAVAKEAQATAIKEQETRAAGFKQQKINMVAELPSSWGTAVLLEARAHLASGDKGRALGAYDTYLAKFPSATDVLTSRGDLKAETGNKAGAAEDYREALRFVPDYKPAIEGLKDSGAPR